ncbi:MAG: hypothetical protein JWO89_1943, partial [Verrucomicrobiaceae bacterium]|nr:hypothetical protein [Verrucomicrobiaceae bacterium]
MELAKANTGAVNFLPSALWARVAAALLVFIALPARAEVKITAKLSPNPVAV